jgi:5-methylcytosine-specific restriction protein A
MRSVAKVCQWCQKTSRQKPCEHCGNPKPKPESQRENYRGSAASRGYGARWQRWRAAILRRMASTGDWDGMCDRCGKMISGSIHCDHITPVASASDPLFYDRENIQFLHPGCHAEKTAEDKQKGLTR